MKEFKSLLKNYSKIYFQPHDNPDADAIASAFGLKHYADLLNVKSEIIYYGEFIHKPNLTAMVQQLNIPIINKDNGFKLRDDELLVVIDAQRGNKNIFSFEAKNIACIDHHVKDREFKYVWSDIQPRIGSCSTLVAKLLFDLSKINKKTLKKEVTTALFFGLLMDTNFFMIKYTSLDKDMREKLETSYDQKVVTNLTRTSLSFHDLQTVSNAMASIERYDDVIYVKLGDCDENLLGHISDLVAQVEGINIVINYSERVDHYKLSIRSYHNHISAVDIITNLTEGIGGGGGHPNKSGGIVNKDSYLDKYPDTTFDTHVKIKTVEFCRTLKFHEVGVDDVLRQYGEHNFKQVTKRPYNVRYIQLSKYFGENDLIDVKTLEGTVRVPATSTIVLGAKGVVFPITDKHFSLRYIENVGTQHTALCDTYINDYGVTLSSSLTDKTIKITSSTLLEAPTAKSMNDSTAWVKEISGGVKVRAQWGDTYMKDDGYLIYIDAENYYLCDEEVYNLTYAPTINKHRELELLQA